MSSNKRIRRHKTDPPPLTAVDVRFCQLVVTENLSHYDAYLKAGNPPKVTRKATDTAVWRLVRKREIREYIRELQNIAATAAKVTVEEIAAAIANIARADRRKLWSKGTLLPPGEWPDDVAATIEAVESEEIFERDPDQKGRKVLVGHTRKVKTASRLAAWSKLAEWKGMTGTKPDAAVAVGEKKPNAIVVERDHVEILPPEEPDAPPGK